MEIPILTKSQKNQGLSSKKGKTRQGVVRNVLGTTNASTCPEISNEASAVLFEKLRGLLSNVVRTRVKWADVKNIPKDKRKQFRSEQQASAVKTNANSHLVLGINATTRAVERKEVSLVLVAKDIKPVVMVKHVIEACNASGILVLSVPHLRQNIKELIGFSSIAIGFKDIPENISPMECDQSEASSAKEEVHTGGSAKFVTKEIIHRDVYLYRDTTDTRCFTPKISKHDVQQTPDYLQFAYCTSAPISECQPKIKNTYKPLKIKRLRPNVHRFHKQKKIKPKPKKIPKTTKINKKKLK